MSKSNREITREAVLALERLISANGFWKTERRVTRAVTKCHETLLNELDEGMMTTRRGNRMRRLGDTSWRSDK